jgi:hypothetical protein
MLSVRVSWPKRMRVLALVLTLGATAHGASDCPDLAPVMLIHDGNYGPGGHGPSFTVDLRADGKVLFRTNEWLCPSGVYTGSLSRQDLELLSCLIGDLLSTPAHSFACGGLHTPGFMVARLRTDDVAGTCVKLIPGSVFEPLYSLLPKVLLRTDLKPFVLSMVDNRSASEGPLTTTPDDDPGFKVDGIFAPDRGPISTGVSLPPVEVIFKGCRVMRPATYEVLVDEQGHPLSARLLKSSGCRGADSQLRAAILAAWFHPAIKDSRFSRGSLSLTIPPTVPEANP